MTRMTSFSRRSFSYTTFFTISAAENTQDIVRNSGISRCTAFSNLQRRPNSTAREEPNNDDQTCP